MIKGGGSSVRVALKPEVTKAQRRRKIFEVGGIVASEESGWRICSPESPQRVSIDQPSPWILVAPYDAEDSLAISTVLSELGTKGAE